MMATDQDAAHLEYTQLKAHLRDLEAALRALTAAEPTYESDYGGLMCGYCDVGAEVPGAPFAFRHAPDCPWLRAKALTALPEAP